MQVVRYSERPELWDSISDLSAQVWPEYNQHGDVLNSYWGRLYDDFPQWQFVLLDEAAGQVLAEGHTIPVDWDGTDPGLGPGIDANRGPGCSSPRTATTSSRPAWRPCTSTETVTPASTGSTSSGSCPLTRRGRAGVAPKPGLS